MRKAWEVELSPRSTTLPGVIYTMEPIGVVHSPFLERREAPRQATVAEDASAPARIELFAGHGYEHALSGLSRFEYVWVIFVFHKNVEQHRGWKPKVQPPRSATKQGLFATRSPHRPNPIGLSAARIDGVEGRVVHVRGLDALDGTPVLDLKPYVAYADARPDAGAGWLAAAPDPLPAWRVAYAESARLALDWLGERGVDLEVPIETTLALGPEPHPYRRIRVRRGEGAGAMTLAFKEWRIDFDVEADVRALVVRRVRSGFRACELAAVGGPEGLELHRSFTSVFG
ncbi:MAG: tRNA (N6-threonylcarbamoyladenosine(37)-N6)-methyltransferase TrmO [Polyangiaceae bacterium]|nr:tRNA (N6-threonylcarbamoyladenosine(37)-N6)-methyltransferase TrmO [Polyangiaceae bacterium]